METSTYVFRLHCMFAGMAIFAGILAVHLYHIQIDKHEYFYQKAKSTYSIERKLTGKRGNIFDYNGSPLTGNYECKTILADLSQIPQDQKKRNYLIGLLSTSLKINPNILIRRFSRNAREVVVKRKVKQEIAEKLEVLRLPGIRFVEDQRRIYPRKYLCSTILGFTNSKNQGVYGLEQIWNKELLPQSIIQKYERDRRGKILKYHTPPSLKPADGNSIYLTIKEPIQHIVESELRTMVKKFSPRRAYAVMIQPKTGAIMAMAQFPSSNPNDRKHMNADHWRNHIMSDVYDPGSTMKPMVIAGAIDYGVVSLDTTIDCEKGYWMYGGRPLRDSGHSFTILTVADILQKSSNIGTAKIALRLGEQRLYQILRRFGFGKSTGMKLGRESSGILRSLDRWDRLSITRFPIGQGISVTPVQLVQAYSAIANEGKMMQLYLVDHIVFSATKNVKQYHPQLKSQVLRPKTANSIIMAMVRVTEKGGTGKNAAIAGYHVAGKTGTSQKLFRGKYTGHGKFIASFIGIVPAENPAFVLLVIADEPKGKYYGGTVAAPTFRNISQRTLQYLNIPPSMATASAKSP